MAGRIVWTTGGAPGTSGRRATSRPPVVPRYSASAPASTVAASRASGGSGTAAQPVSPVWTKSPPSISRQYSRSRYRTIARALPPEVLRQGEPVALRVVQAGAPVGGYPHPSGGVLDDGARRGLDQALGVPVGLKGSSVEAGQAAGAADPEIAALVLVDRPDLRGGQPVVRPPVAERQHLALDQGGPAGHRQHREQETQTDHGEESIDWMGRKDKRFR